MGVLVVRILEALYRAASIFDHSCSPSATTVFHPGTRNQSRTKFLENVVILSLIYVKMNENVKSRMFHTK
jgi:hypothetical protein